MELPPALKKTNSGQSLVEILASLAVVSLIVAGALVGISHALKNSQFSSNQTLASKYAQEGVEKARDLKNQNETLFWQKTGTETEILGSSIFTREITYTLEADNKMKVKVIVFWQDNSGKHQAELSTYFTKW